MCSTPAFQLKILPMQPALLLETMHPHAPEYFSFCQLLSLVRKPSLLSHLLLPMTLINHLQRSYTHAFQDEVLQDHDVSFLRKLRLNRSDRTSGKEAFHPVNDGYFQPVSNHR